MTDEIALSAFQINTRLFFPHRSYYRILTGSMPLDFSRQEPSSTDWKGPICWEWGPDRLLVSFPPDFHGCQRINLEDRGLAVVVGVSREHFLLTKANTVSSLNPLYLACLVNPEQPFLINNFSRSSESHSLGVPAPLLFGSHSEHSSQGHPWLYAVLDSAS